MFKMANKEFEAMFAFCARALERAKNVEGIIPIEFSGLNAQAIEKISNYLKEKNSSNEYIIMELKGPNFYEAHIKYKK